MNQNRPLTPQAYYRLPWNLADNAITWLEPTTKCNLYCEGCYRENDPAGHKPLSQVIADVDASMAMRRTDGISIAGGEPLIYPHIVDLVRYVASKGAKPVINSNGQALTPELVRDLTEAGLVGFTMHVDSHQKRPGHTGQSEAELCELRLRLAQMIHEHGRGRVACAFNATIYRDTLDQLPMLTRWAQEHMDLVQTMVYILFRSAKRQNDFDCHVGGAPVDLGALTYQLDNMEGEKDILAQEVADQIREQDPDFEPCAYLNGTEDPLSMKWLLTLRVGSKDRILGYMDPKFAEMVQTFHHLLRGTYLAYVRPWVNRAPQAMFPLALINRGLRRVLAKWLGSPSRLGQCLHTQSIMIIQPCDLLPQGQQNMCDGCPDAIHHQGRMVWSCRVDELEKFGGFITCTPKGKTLPAVRGQSLPATKGEAQPVAQAKPVPQIKPVPKAKPARAKAAKAKTPAKKP
jgi:organic radical activating enzyme